MNKLFFLVVLSLFSSYIFSQNYNIEPWGVWNCEPLRENPPIVRLVSGNYYNSNHAFSWIAISQNAEGLVAGNFNFPLLGIEGMYIQIERYEQLEDGYIFHLIGTGFRRGEERTQFKENTRLTLKMIFLSENECKFYYLSKTDSDGYHLAFSFREDVIYRRYRVQE